LNETDSQNNNKPTKKIVKIKDLATEFLENESEADV